MKVQITRNMTVANSRGEAEAFEKSDAPIEVDADTYRRLNRAGAAVVADVQDGDGTEVGSVGVAEMTVAGTGGEAANGSGEDILRKGTGGAGPAGAGMDSLDGDQSGEGEGEGDGNSDETETAEDLMKLNKDDLIAKAEAEGVEVKSGDTKQDIADAIIAKRSEA